MDQKTPANENVAKIAKEIKGIRFAMLTTVAMDGSLHSRPMAAQEQDFDGDLWFFTGKDSVKVDELERSLYNGALAGVSLAGNSYFYENPLEAGRDRARWSWHACPCCPPMFLKLMGGLQGYIYATSADAVYVNLFVGSRANFELPGEDAVRVTLTQKTAYPWKGDVRLTVEPERAALVDRLLELLEKEESARTRISPEERTWEWSLTRER